MEKIAHQYNYRIFNLKMDQHRIYYYPMFSLINIHKYQFIMSIFLILIKKCLHLNIQNIKVKMEFILTINKLNMLKKLNIDNIHLKISYLYYINP